MSSSGDAASREAATLESVFALPAVGDQIESVINKLRRE
jgi:hypothetical protein